MILETCGPWQPSHCSWNKGLVLVVSTSHSTSIVSQLMRMQTVLELEDSATIGPFWLAMVAWINVGEGAGHHLPQHLRLEHLNSFRNFSLQAPWRYELKPFVSILKPSCRASRIPFDSYITSPLALYGKGFIDVVTICGTKTSSQLFFKHLPIQCSDFLTISSAHPLPSLVSPSKWKDANATFWLSVVPWY